MDGVVDREGQRVLPSLSLIGLGSREGHVPVVSRGLFGPLRVREKKDFLQSTFSTATVRVRLLYSNG